VQNHHKVPVALYVAITACFIGVVATAEPKKAPIRIGAIHNLTGALGSIGAPSMAGARLAVKQLNARGGLLGRSVELPERDGQSDPALVAAATRELVRTPGVSAITGLNDTSMVLAAAPIAEKARMVFLTSGATSPLVPLQFPRYYFMACFGDNTQAAAGAEYAYGTLEAKTAWLLFDDTTDYTVLLARYFRERYTELGGVIVGDDIYAGGTVDFSDQIARILALPARPTCCTSRRGRRHRPAREATARGGDQSADRRRGRLRHAAPSPGRGRCRRQHLLHTHAFLDPSAGHAGRAAVHRRLPGRIWRSARDAFAALGYDAVMLIANAIERADSAKQKALPEALEATGDFVGITGSISFGPLTHLPKKR
jgi:branched-chain amino acid transport system substrate-binding protein